MPRFHAPSDRADVYARVTAEIIAAIESGTGTWSMPWHHDGGSTGPPDQRRLVAALSRHQSARPLGRRHSARLYQWPLGTYRAWAAVERPGPPRREGHHRRALEGGARRKRRR